MSAANAPVRQSLVWRVLTTPIGPRILPKWERAPGVAEVVGRAGLPAGLGALAAETARRTRLWRRERAEIAAELCGHFAGGLAAGRTADELIAGFGEVRTAAALMRRARLRSRPRFWRVLRRVRQGVLAAIAIVALLVVGQVIRFITATPSIRHDYLRDLNAASLAVPESERAWPLYREAALTRTRTPPALQTAWGPITPADPRWAAVVEQVGANQGAIGLIREAARRSKLGLVLSDRSDPEIWARRGVTIPPRPAPACPELRELDLEPYVLLAQQANLLVHDACVRAERRDGAAVVRDLADIVAIAEQLRQMPILQAQGYAVAIFGGALDAAGVVMRQWAASLSDEDWAAAAHALTVFGGGGQVRLRFEGERVFVRDLAQRLYSAGGSLTPAGLRFTRGWAAPKAAEPTAAQTVAFALAAALVVPSRAEFERAYERAVAVAEAESALPLYQREGRDLRDAIFGSPRPWTIIWSSTAFPTEFFPAALRSAGVAAEQATQRRDAMLTVIAMELFRRRHGAYPESLAELVPALLPAVPMDRYDGGRLKYVLRDEGPLLYVVGTNRRDDGGRPPGGPQYEWRFTDWVSEETLRTTTRFFEQEPRYQGDWILWPMEPQRPPPGDGDGAKEGALGPRPLSVAGVRP